MPHKITKISAFLRDLSAFDPAQQARHDYANVFLRSMRDIASLSPTKLSECSVLVLGCGYNYPDVILYSTVAKRVAGIDVVEVFYRDKLLPAVGQAFCSPRRVATTIEAIARQRHYGRYYRHLEDTSGVEVEHPRYELASYDGTHIPFDANAFDVVLSNAVLEHVDDVDQVVSELFRVTKVGGLSYHLWHNYYSCSGSHLPEKLRRSAPWGHLRGVHQTRGLNRLRPDQVSRAFAPRFDVAELVAVDREHRKQGVDPGFQFEEEGLLTAPIRRELEAYDPELLLTRAYLLMAKKTA